MNLIAPDLWEVIKENILIVLSSGGVLYATFRVFISTLKVSADKIGDKLREQKDSFNNNVNDTLQKKEEARTLIVERGQLTLKKLELKKEIIDYRVKLDFVEKVERRTEIENEIALLSNELEQVNSEIETTNNRIKSLL